MQTPVRVTLPAEAPISLAEAKQHCRIDHDDDDALIGGFIDAAVAHFDGWSGTLGRCLVNQVWRQTTWRWCREVRLAFPDVSAVVVKYIDPDGAEQTVAADQYELIHDGRSTVLRYVAGFAGPALAERGDAVRYTITAGYGADGGAVPAPIRTAIAMLVAHFYNNREAAGEQQSELPFSVSALCAPYRRTGL